MPTIDQILTDERLFIETLLAVENKQGRLVPFILNPIQDDYMRTSSGRDIAVKPAQVGFTSIILARRFHNTITQPGTNTVIIAYEDFITQRILRKVSFFYKVLQDRDIPGLPKLHHDSAYEKTFPQINSSIYIASARSFAAGRSESIHHLVCDEMAFWPPGSVDRILAGAVDRVPIETGTIDIMSTANGKENDFAAQYEMAKSGTGKGKSTFRAHFYPWYMHPEYTIKKTSPLVAFLPDECQQDIFDLSEEEANLVYNRHLTFDQIRWRRYKIQEKESLSRAGRTRILFQQEFPEDDVSCFLVTGDMFYSHSIVEEKLKHCYDAPHHYEQFDVWFPPEDGKWCLVSIDPGLGKVSRSAISVVTFDEDGNPIHCARAAGWWLPEYTYQQAEAIATYYNHATMAWERNLQGFSEMAKDYPDVYYEQDIISGAVSDQRGWLTTPKKKEYMFHTMVRYLPRITSYDTEFWGECQNIRYAGNKMNIVGLDDIHDSMAIALVCKDAVQPTGKTGLVGTSGFTW